MTESRPILVMGTGTMGIQISHVLAMKGYSVLLKNTDKQTVEFALEKIRLKLQKNIEKKEITKESAEAALTKITGITSSQEIKKNVWLTIETIVEDLSKKKLLLKDLSKTLSPSCIIASNTSSLSISELSKSIDYPERFIGLHFLNPATSINLVEIIKGDKTSALTCSVVKEFAIKLGKTPILLKDSPGFLINRMLIPAINEAAFILEAGIASKEEIDLSMKLGAKHPLGPFELADLIGIDVCLSIMESLYKQFNDPKYRPCPLLIRMVNMNQLGRKNKKGFYTY